MALLTLSTTESTARSRTVTFTLPRLVSINNVSVNTGNVTVSSVVGEEVTVALSNGAYTRRPQTGGSYTPGDSKFVTGQTSSNYNSGGYSGTLSQYLYSGSYTSSDTKFVTGQTSPTYNVGGYVGTLSSYVISGTYTPADSKTVSTTRELNDGHPGDFEIPYNSGGYSGTLSWVGATEGYTGTKWFHEYRGVVTRPASDTRVYRYEGNVTRPASDTRVYRYEGTVYKPESDTRTYTSYYQYNVTFDYLDNVAPTTPGAFTSPSEGSSFKGGASVSYSWGSSSDSDGDSLTYHPQYRYYKNGIAQSWENATSGTSRTGTLTVSNDREIDGVEFRVRAYDGMAYSLYRTSSKFNINHNELPTVSVKTDGNYHISNGEQISHLVNSPFNFTIEGNDADEEDTIEYKIVVGGVVKTDFTPMTKLQSYPISIASRELGIGQNSVDIAIKDGKGEITTFNFKLNTDNILPTSANSLATMKFNNYTKSTISLAELVNHLD